MLTSSVQSTTNQHTKGTSFQSECEATPVTSALHVMQDFDDLGSDRHLKFVVQVAFSDNGGPLRAVAIAILLARGESVRT